MLKRFCTLTLCLCLVLALALPAAADTAVVRITTAEELLELASNCRLDRYSQNLTVSLDADIDLQGREFAGIPIFCGTFLGNGHRVSNAEVKTVGSNQGFFRYLAPSARVQDLTVMGRVLPGGQPQQCWRPGWQ